MPHIQFKKQLATELKKRCQLAQNEEDILKEFTTPPNIELGHIAFPCFKFAKEHKKNPAVIAKEFSEKFYNSAFKAKEAGPYINFKFPLKEFYKTVSSQIAKSKQAYGGQDSAPNQKIIIEYCSPNIAKRLGFQHIRSTLIGNTLANIYKHLNYNVTRINFIGDWGTQFAKLLAAYEKWGDSNLLSLKDIPSSMEHLLSLYVKFHKEIEENPEYEKLSSLYLQKLEKKDPKAFALWKLIRQISLESMQHVLTRMHVNFDVIEGESEYIDSIEKTLTEIKQKAKAEISDGAWIVKVEGSEVPALIQKKDGTTLYLTRDIAAALQRKQTYNFDKMLYVVSEQQKLHFQLLFSVLKKMGETWSTECEHVSFGTVFFGEDKLSTRQGNVLFLESVLNEAKKRALELCLEKNPELPNKEEVAEQVGVGAILFGELTTHRQRDFEFKWEHILTFEGETGPYIQYTLVRCNSLLEKLKSPKIITESPAEWVLEEEGLLSTLSRFQESLLQCVEENEPFYLTKYLSELAKAFNRFYYKVPVIQCTNSELQLMRISLVLMTKQVLENGLNLLGIECPQEM